MGRFIDDLVANSPELREEAASMNTTGSQGQRARMISLATREFQSVKPNR
jgi:hypothetical protein